MSLHSVDNNTVTEQLVCFAGHEWTWENAHKGGRPKHCPRHRRFAFEQLSQRLRPSTTVLQEWAEQGKMLDDEDYVERWRQVWNHTVRLMGARHQSWVKVDVDLVERYVRSLRLAELHRLYAQDRPYIEARGTVKAHPGWELADKEERKAEKLALEMNLTGPQEYKVDQPKPQSQYKSRMQQSAGDHDTVLPALGPDGEGL